MKIFVLATFLLVSAIDANVGPYPSAPAHGRQPRVRSSNGFTHTNAWWSNWNLGEGTNPIQTYPFVVKTSTKGFVIAYGGQVLTSTKNVQTVINDNLVLSTRETFGTATIDASTVNGDALDLSAKVNFGSAFDVTVIRGSATIVANIHSSTPVLKTIHAILTSSYPGQRSLKIVLNNGQSWLIQSQYPIVWSLNGGDITAPSAYTGWVKISIVPSIGAEALLLQTLDSVMTNGKVSYKVDRSAKEVSVSVTYNSDSVYFVLPHMTNIYDSISGSGGNYEGHGIKGVYKLSRGTGYTYKLPIFTGADPNNAVNTADKRAKLSAALKDDVQNLRIDPKDPYFGGKAMARMANLIEIAHLLGDEESKTRARDKVINELDTYWFATNDPKLVYEPTWGGIVSKSSVGDFGADFGNYVYNDHHFHYGYFTYVAYVLAKYYPSMYTSRAQYFEPIFADFGGTCKYTNMPCRARNKDAFLGFSYAGGLNEFADSKDQESSSESVNSYVSLRKLAQAINDKTLEDQADYLLSSEIVSCQAYWHIKSGSSVYASPFADNGVVGIVWETKADYATWFGGNPEFIWAIQILPVSDISPALLTQSWLQSTRSVWRAALDAILPSEGKFSDILLQADAIANPTRPGLADEIHRLSTFDDGNCRTNQLYFFYMVGGSPSDATGTAAPTSATSAPTGGTTGSGGGDQGIVTPLCNQSVGELGCFNSQNALTGCYMPNIATCYAGGYICPIPYVSCLAACYDPSVYGCSNGQLVLIG